MKFKSPEAAIQFLADKVAELSDRTYNLENANIAKGTALKAIIAFLGQLPPITPEMISGLFAEEADQMEAHGKETPDMADRWIAIAKELRNLATASPDRPQFTVIAGGRSDNDGT